MNSSQEKHNSTAYRTGAVPDTRKGLSITKESGLLIALISIVILLWCCLYDRWDLSLPVSIDADSGYVLGMIRLAQNGDLGPVGHIKTESLGAPFIGNLNDFPQLERLILWTGGILARGVGLYPAANLMVIGLHLFAGISFYYAARLWRIRISIAWPLALVYAFSHQTVRSLPHLGIGYFGLLPMQLYICWYIATAPKISLRSNRFKLSAVIGLISGAVSLYWVVFFLQLYGSALLYRLFKRRKYIYQSLIPPLLTSCMAAILLGSFVVYQIENGHNPGAIIRSYRDTEVYSLKPIDLFIPKTGQALGMIDSLYRRYITGGAVRLGEAETAYIGLLCISGIILLTSKSIQRQIRGKNLPLPALIVLGVWIYYSFGGLHSLFSLITNNYLIRSTNRYSAAISTTALLYFAFFFYRKSRNWSNPLRISLIFLISALALFDQSYGIYLSTRESNPAALMKVRIENDRQLAVALERSVPARSMLFMLPVVDFPESGVAKLGGYEYFRPFLYTTQLRYSFGSNKGRPESDWQHVVAALPPAEMTQALESYGFAGILLNRRGYQDSAQKILNELKMAGYQADFEQGKENEWVFIQLNPAHNPKTPALTSSKSLVRGL